MTFFEGVKKMSDKEFDNLIADQQTGSKLRDCMRSARDQNIIVETVPESTPYTGPERVVVEL